MPNVNGTVYYDPTRSGNVSLSTGIPNVPVVLYSSTLGLGAIVLTDALGAYQFTNVPAGNYSVVESWVTLGGTPSPVNFATNAIPMTTLPTEAEPPLSALPGTVTPSALATRLDAITPNLLNITVGASDVNGINFFDGQIGDNPLTLTGVTKVGPNLITIADNGTFGAYAAGTAVGTSANPNPYPGISTGFIYSTLQIPPDGYYTITNTNTLGRPYPWWRVSDHTTGLETGRLMLINGANPGSIIVSQKVNVLPNTNYLLSGWILNLINTGGYSPAQLSFKVIGSDGTTVISFEKVNNIQNSSIPLWYQNGSIFNSGAFSSITVQVLSEGPAASGNDFVIDDISLYQVAIANELSVKKVMTPSIVYPGNTVTIAATVTNISTVTIPNVMFSDPLDPELSFNTGSVTVNGSGVGYAGANPNTPFNIGTMAPGDIKVVQFTATVVNNNVSPIKNIANSTYNILTSGTGDVQTNTVSSSQIFIRLLQNDFSAASAALAESISLEETALGDLLTAESAKINQLIKTPNVTPQQLIDMNNTVTDTVNAITRLNCVLEQKLEVVKKQLVGYCNN